MKFLTVVNIICVVLIGVVIWFYSLYIEAENNFQVVLKGNYHNLEMIAYWQDEYWKMYQMHNKWLDEQNVLLDRLIADELKKH